MYDSSMLLVDERDAERLGEHVDLRVEDALSSTRWLRTLTTPPRRSPPAGFSALCSHQARLDGVHRRRAARAAKNGDAGARAGVHHALALAEIDRFEDPRLLALELLGALLLDEDGVVVEVNLVLVGSSTGRDAFHRRHGGRRRHRAGLRGFSASLHHLSSPSDRRSRRVARADSFAEAAPPDLDK